MYTVVGIAHKVGDYNGQSYDNMKLHCVRDATPNTDEDGQITEVLKVKTSLFEKFDISIGSVVTPFYDKYKNVVHLVVE